MYHSSITIQQYCVPFDKLHPYFSSKSEAPAIGNVMASRWAYEALTVTQFKDNKYEKVF